jgi:DNA-binding NarL/FixJ family response regulator
MLNVRTFIVEDSPIILDKLVLALEELTPVKVVGSAAGEADALRAIGALDANLDLLIVDLFLKSGSGFGVLKRVADAGVPGKRVVLTNYATAEVRRKCLALGANRVFDKSSELEELIEYCGRIADGDADTRPGELT